MPLFNIIHQIFAKYFCIYPQIMVRVAKISEEILITYFGRLNNWLDKA